MEPTKYPTTEEMRHIAIREDFRAACARLTAALKDATAAQERLNALLPDLDEDE